jgi:hypothetical protein
MSELVAQTFHKRAEDLWLSCAFSSDPAHSSHDGDMTSFHAGYEWPIFQELLASNTTIPITQVSLAASAVVPCYLPRRRQ